MGHAVPLGYAAYAVVPLPDAEPEADLGWPPVLDTLLGVLAGVTGDQAVHCAMWDGWAWWYSSGEDPRTAPGMSAHVAWAEGDEPGEEERARALAEARERLAADRVRHPAVAPLDLPHRSYHVWTGPLASVLAFRHHPWDPPSLVWPEERSWFVGAPIYTNEIAVAGPGGLIDVLIADPLLGARRATPDDVLDIYD